jgi:hypothetical protein
MLQLIPNEHRPAERIAPSVVVRLIDEEDNVALLCRRCVNADGATALIRDHPGRPHGAEARRGRRHRFPHPRGQFPQHNGQIAAMMAGIDYAGGADGWRSAERPQGSRAPAGEVRRGFDVVSDWRRERQDCFMTDALPPRSRTSSSRVSGVPLHDYGCSLKAYRRVVLQGFRLNGEMHRFIPIYARAWVPASLSWR